MILMLVILVLVGGCSERRPTEQEMPDEDPYPGMIEVDVGNGETRWIRAYDDVPVNPLCADQFKPADGGSLRYTGDEYTVLQGIDVSIFQGTIDWAAVAEDGVDFAMLRIGGRGYESGEIYEDDSFLSNLHGAADNGLRVGAYFFSQAVNPEEAAEEAEYVLGILRDLPEGSVTMPVAFDWEMIEGDEARTVGVDAQTLTSCALAFCSRIAAGGYEPMVYAYRYLAYDMYDLSALLPYPLWISTLDGNPDFYYSFDMWQYTENGYVNGIETRVDRNLYFLPGSAQVGQSGEQTG